MSHIQQRDFIKKTKDHFPEYFKDVKVVEIGSLNINGTVRDFFSDTKSYVGVDLIEGKDVDVISLGKDYDPGNESIDTVVSTECFEHDKEWQKTFANMIRMCKVGGMVIFTCASEGRHEHGTTRTSPADSPATTDYYENRVEKDFREVFDIERLFSKHLFEYNPITCDLYFWGIKK
jgi:SAM-dependent methyltransferase